MIHEIIPVRWNKVWSGVRGGFDFAIVERIQYWPLRDVLGVMRPAMSEVGHHFPTLYEWREPGLTAQEIGQFMGGN